MFGRNIPWKSFGNRCILNSALAISFMDLASKTRRNAFFPASKSELFTADSKTPEIWTQTVKVAQIIGVVKRKPDY